MKLQLTLWLRSLAKEESEGNGVDKSKQTAVRQVEDLFSILSNVFLSGGSGCIVWSRLEWFK